MADEEAKRFIQEVWGLQGTAYLFVGLRFAGKASMLGRQGLAWDDALMALATLVYTAESVAAYFVVEYWKGLANNGMTDEQRVLVDPDSEEFRLRVNGSKTHVIGLLLYTTLLWLLKGCWVVYYARLTDGVLRQRKIVKWTGVITVVTYISCLLIAFLKCIPFNHQWQINPSPGNSCMPAISFIQTVYVMAMNTITDLLLMAIPLPMVWKANLPPKKKLTLLVMFGGGFLEMTFGILRCVSILTLGDKNPAQSGYWSIRESFVCFILTNMPVVYSLFRRLLGKHRDKSKSSGLRTADCQGCSLSNYPRATRATCVNAKGGRGPLPSKAAAWGAADGCSEEHIVGSSELNDLAGEDVGRTRDPNVILVTTEYIVAETDSGITMKKGDPGYDF